MTGVQDFCPAFERAFTKDLSKFADHKTIASCLNAPVYFAHPHSPWERGTNENTNRLLRQYFPKKTKAVYTAEYLADCRQKLTRDPENAWALHHLLLASFLNLGGCTSELNLPTYKN